MAGFILSSIAFEAIVGTDGLSEKATTALSHVQRQGGVTEDLLKCRQRAATYWCRARPGYGLSMAWLSVRLLPSQQTSKAYSTVA